MQCCPVDIVSEGGGCNVALRTLLVGGGVQCCPEDIVSGGGGAMLPCGHC